MRNGRIARCLAVMALIFLGFLALGMALNRLTPLLTGIDSVTAADAPEAPDDNQGITFRVSQADREKGWALMYDFLLPFSVNGHEVDRTGVYTVFPGLYAFDIPAAWLGGGEAEITLHSPGQGKPRVGPMYVCSAETARWLSDFCGALQPMVAGGFLIMALYGGSLFLYKKSEKYLLSFSAYTGLLFLWTMPSILPRLFPTSLGGTYFLYNCAILTSLVMCVQLCGIGKSSRFFRWYTLIPAVAGAAAALSYAGFSFRAMEWARFFLYLLDSLLLTWACARGMKDGWLLLCGLLGSQAARVLILFIPDSRIAFTLMTVKYLRLGILIFVFCCMLMINRRFAGKYREAEMLAHTLEIKVQERTAELTRQQQRLQNITTNIFHDLRTPLFIMKGCLEQLRAGDRREEYLETAENRLQFMTGLVNDLFSAIKLENGTTLMDTEPVDLGALLRRVEKGVSLQAREKGVALGCQCLPGSALVWGDEVRLEEAFQNLVTNAIYYTAAQGRVDIRLEREGDMLAVRVSDTGCGISPEERDKIFERYYISKYRSRHDSSGLGLSIAKSIIQLHHGALQVESQVGQGTVMIVRLLEWRKKA